MASFSSQVSNLLQAGPVVDIQIAPSQPAVDAMLAAGQSAPNPVTVSAMIDTGAANSVMAQDLAAQLGLQPIGTVTITTPSSVNVPCLEYVVRLVFPNNTTIETAIIAAPMQGQNVQCLIGREVLAHAVFVYTGFTNTFTLSF